MELGRHDRLKICWAMETSRASSSLAIRTYAPMVERRHASFRNLCPLRRTGSNPVRSTKFNGK